MATTRFHATSQPSPENTATPADLSSRIQAAFSSRIELADIHSEEVAEIARMSFEERWARAEEMADLVVALAELRDA